MSTDLDLVVTVRMPQVNVNDTEVKLVGWHVAEGHSAIAGEPLCEVETSKSVGDVPAPASGLLHRTVQVGEMVGVGEVIGYLGPSTAAIERSLSAETSKSGLVGIETPGQDDSEATAGAVELANRYGVNLKHLKVSGKIRRGDVERFIADHHLAEQAVRDQAVTEPHDELPGLLADKVVDAGELSAHQWSVARHLQETQSRTITAHVSMDVSMQAAQQWILNKRRSGMIVGPLPILLHASAAAIRSHERVISFRIGRRVYRYRNMDIAYTARDTQRRLFTPVVRNVDVRSLDDLMAECGRLNMAVVRGTIGPVDLAGGCFTVSLLNEFPVTQHIGLQNAWQSVILTAGAIRDLVVMIENEPVARPTMTLTLSYDHGLLDGWEAAAFLNTVKVSVETLNV